MAEKRAVESHDRETCPRCQASLGGARGDRCSLCGLAVGAAFDPTGGLPDGAKYLAKIIGGHFRTLAVLACGGHGMVLLVRHTKLENRNIFALKLLRPELSRNDEFRRRFLREAEIVYTFSHPNIVPIREFAETEEGELFFTMDFCRGVTLDEAMRAGPRFPLDRALRIADDILQGLDFAHRHSVVHRDLKPANVSIEQTREGELARLLDFGIAKPTEAQGIELTQGNAIIGTPAYMSPEQILGRDLDPRTDLYSFGVLFYRMLAGKPPFSGKTGHEILAHHLHDRPESLKKFLPDVPVKVSLLVDRLLAKAREERPPTALAVRRELAEVRARLAPSAPAGAVESTGERPRRRARIAAAVAFLLSALGFAGWLAFSAPGRALAESVMPVARPATGDYGARGDEAAPSGGDRAPAPPAPDQRALKWCRFCRQPLPESMVTCPDCGQMLTRVPPGAVPRGIREGGAQRNPARQPHP